MKCSNSKYKQKSFKESVKWHSRNAWQTKKKHSTQLSLEMTPPYQ